MDFLWILILAGLAVGGIVVFNRLIGLKNAARGAWSDIDVQLKRRHDLIGTLVETVKGYAAHEKQTLEEVTRARSAAESSRENAGPAQTAAAENLLTGRLTGLLALAEAYPDLKASDRFLDLQRALVQVEDDLQNARRYYNAVIRDFNTMIQSFPQVLVARTFGFQPGEFFEIEDPAERAAPDINLGETS